MATASLNADEEDSSPPSTFASRFRLPRSRSATVASPGDRNARLKTKALSAWNNLRNGERTHRLSTVRSRWLYC